MALKPAAKKVVDAFINGATEVPQPRSSDFHVEGGVLKVNSTRLAELSADGFYIIWVGRGGTDYQDSAYRYLKKNVPKKWFKDEPHSLSRNGKRTRLDQLLDKVKSKESELTLDAEGYTKAEVRKVLDAAKSRGFHAAHDGRFILIRDLREMQKNYSVLRDHPTNYRANGRGTIADDEAARELVLFSDNTDGLTPMSSRGQGKAIHENMMRKIRSGKFDPMKVPKALEHLMETAAKQYARDFASPGEWSQMFNAATRRMAASMMAEDYLDELAAQGLI